MRNASRLRPFVNRGYIPAGERRRMNFIVTSREQIERGIVTRHPYIVISVRDPGSRMPKLKQTAGLRGVLRLAFDDAEPAASFRLPKNVRLMTEEDARSIASFVHKHLDEVALIVCHCEQGMSRSPAIAVALAESLGANADNIRAESQPNAYVYQLVLDAMRQTQA